MSFTPQAEIYARFESNRFVTKEEVFFDELIHAGDVDNAGDFIHDHVDTLGYEIREKGYSSRFFRAALKEIAMPMYRKMNADTIGRPYTECRTEIPAMYDNAVNLMRLLEEMKNGNGPAAQSPDQQTYNEIRGDMSELTVFALAVRNLVGVEDDYTIMPSDARQDAGPQNGQGMYTGFDFVVYDRVRDRQYPLQIKTSVIDKRYFPHIAVMSVADFASPLHVTPLELQQAIVSDTNRSSYLTHRAARRMGGMLSNALKDVENE